MNIRPPSLTVGDQVGIIAPAKNIDKASIAVACDTFTQWGLGVKKGKSLFRQHFQFAGTDEERKADFQSMLDDPEIKAIICARGGYGTTRIIDALDFSHFIKSPKWLCGFSDITAGLCHLLNLGIESIHGIMPLGFNKNDAEISLHSLKNILFGEAMTAKAKPHHLNRTGKAKGPLVGGNLSVLCHIIGTRSDFDTNNKILFLEDINEYLYHIDRMLVQLKRAGKLQNLAGLVIGQMTGIQDDNPPFGEGVNEVILSHVKDFSYPVCFNFPIGHEGVNIALPVGRDSFLSVNDEVILNFN